MHHASTIDCGGNAPPVTRNVTGCNLDEYGDPFDVMGAHGDHENHGMHKAELDLLSGTMKTVTSDGVYPLSPAEPGFGGNQVLRIPRANASPSADADYYYLDYRQPYGLFDGWFTLATRRPLASPCASERT